MIVNKVPPKAIDKKLPSIIPDVCFVGDQNSVESGVVFVTFWRSATNFFIAFKRLLNSSTDSFDKSSEKSLK